MSHSTLPNELWDRIIDRLYDQPRTLAACCLVAKAWLPSSQHHLFRLVDIWRAVKFGPEEVIRYHLVQEGVNINMPHRKYGSLLHVAVRGGNAAIVELLIADEALDVNIRDEFCIPHSRWQPLRVEPRSFGCSSSIRT